MSRLSFLVSGVLLPLILTACALFFLIYLKGVPFRGFFSSLRRLKDRTYGERSPLQTVSLALAGTLGVGNMVGVAAALKEGGAGVLFWMWLSCFAAMVVKYTEIVLSIRRRSQARRAEGAAAYMTPFAGAVFSTLCLLCAFSVGCALQTGAFAGALSGGQQGTAHPLLSLLAGALLCLPLSAALFQKSTPISRLTLWLVPLMSLLYLFLCIGVLFCHRQALLPALKDVFLGALSPKKALLGGGTAFFTALRLGVVRGILSNEAGCGTAPFAYAKAPAAKAEAQGTLGMVEVAFDTLFLCTLTGLTLLVCPQSLEASTAVGALLYAFSTVFGRISGPLLTLSLYFFALATLLCWSFYGKCCLAYLLPKRKTERLFDLLFCLAVLLSPLLSEEVVLAIADPTVALMTLLNLFFLLHHKKEVRSFKK